MPCSSSPSTPTDRGFTETVRLAEEVGVLEGGRAPSQLLRQVAVEALGGAGGGRPAGALPGLGQLQALHLLGHQPREVSAPRGRRDRSDFIPSFFHLVVLVHRKHRTKRSGWGPNGLGNVLPSELGVKLGWALCVKGRQHALTRG